jgi:tRNA dimethylallyltransferase
MSRALSDSPILALVGPTSVGKTDLAWQLCNSLSQDIDLLSADSRQVYRGVEVLSGAWWPEGAVLTNVPELTHPFWQWQGPSGQVVRVHGVAMLAPDAEWSLAEWQRLATQVRAWSHNQDARQILVGGTGLYVSQAFVDAPLQQVAPNLELRERWADISVGELQAEVARVASERWSLMNPSDRANPRRLIRVLEQAGQPFAAAVSQEELFIVGCQRPWGQIEERITARVRERWQIGALGEVERLVAIQDNTAASVMTTTGVREITEFLANSVSAEEAQAAWFRRERSYAKRQLTWWQKYSPDVWIDLDSLNPLDSLLTELLSQGMLEEC